MQLNEHEPGSWKTWVPLPWTHHFTSLILKKFGYLLVLLVFVSIEFWFTVKEISTAFGGYDVFWSMNYLSSVLPVLPLRSPAPVTTENMTPSWILWEPGHLYWGWLGYIINLGRWCWHVLQLAGRLPVKLPRCGAVKDRASSVQRLSC